MLGAGALANVLKETGCTQCVVVERQKKLLRGTAQFHQVFLATGGSMLAGHVQVFEQKNDALVTPVRTLLSFPAQFGCTSWSILTSTSAWTVSSRSHLLLC